MINFLQLLENGKIADKWDIDCNYEIDDQEIYDSVCDFIDKNEIVSLSYHPHLDTEDDRDVIVYEFTEPADRLDVENLTIYKLPNTEIYFAVIGGDWQTPANLVFKYIPQRGVLPLLYFQNLNEDKSNG